MSFVHKYDNQNSSAGTPSPKHASEIKKGRNLDQSDHTRVTNQSSEYPNTHPTLGIVIDLQI
ncbi:hypothetical protein GLW08_10280 [Pontibacillus yanchengensis]|uniref:Uncharacterized protein n=2 Tax=Pontibacillus yanchengensis TaxID=462910 RepID=A0ACC7VG92_9BACI|nr:hypothetical protein [Pontibacillus yanchengensis]MYL34251.1 hypothetical protein [Pontibacillus yanchengensis]MYL53722.1 hypothetical protein [Pontibacillus yanchengensis]